MPKLRFSGFEGEWGKVKLGDIGKFTKGAPLSKADISDNGNPLILYGELYTTYNEITYEVHRKTDKTVSEQYYSKIGDVIIPTSGETPEEIATATCVMLPNVILAGDLNIYRTSFMDGRIISFIINHVINGRIAKVAQGKSVVHVSAEEIAKISINYPSDKEQEKIISFLELLDKRISKQRELVESLKSYKRGVLNLIFNRKKSFCNYGNSNWEYYKMSDLFMPLMDKNHPNDVVLTIVQGIGTVPRDSIDRHISYNKDYVSSYKRVMKGDFILHLRSFEGGLEVANENGIVSPAYTVLRSKVPISTSFYYAYFRSFEFIEKKLRISVEGIRDGKSINMQTFWDITIPFPSYEEQKKISSFLIALDTISSIETSTLDSLVTYKQVLLGTLFI